MGYTNEKRGLLDVFFLVAIKEYEGIFLWGICLGQAYSWWLFSPFHHDSYLKKTKVKVRQNWWEGISPKFRGENEKSLKPPPTDCLLS